MSAEFPITNIQFPMTEQPRRAASTFDLEERTAVLGERIIAFAKRIPKTTITIPITDQLIRSGTSIGSNYCEADCAESRKDFEHKLGIAKKESKETKHWLRMMTAAIPVVAEEARLLWKEADEIQRILIAIIRSSRKNDAR